MTLSPASSRGSGSGGGLSPSATIGPLGAPQSTLDFTGISAGGNALLLVAQLKDTAVTGFALVRFNGDSGTNYDFGTMTQAAASVTGANSAAATSIQVPTSGSAVVGTNPGVFTMWLPGYALTGFRKVAYFESGFDLATPVNNVTVAGEWINTAAINQVTLVANTSWNNGTVAYLYVL